MISYGAKRIKSNEQGLNKKKKEEHGWEEFRQRFETNLLNRKVCIPTTDTFYFILWNAFIFDTVCTYIADSNIGRNIFGVYKYKLMQMVVYQKPKPYVSLVKFTCLLTTLILSFFSPCSSVNGQIYVCLPKHPKME